MCAYVCGRRRDRGRDVLLMFILSLFCKLHTFLYDSSIIVLVLYISQQQVSFKTVSKITGILLKPFIFLNQGFINTGKLI